MKKIIFSLVTGLIFSACSDQVVDLVPESQNQSQTAELKKASLNDEVYKADGYLVMADELTSSIEDDIVKANGKISRKLSEIGLLVVESDETGFIEKAKKIKGVKAVLPDIKLQWIDPEIKAIQFEGDNIGENEVWYHRQWGLRAIDAPGAWDKGYTGEGVRVFILDSGIDAENYDLAPNVVPYLSASFVPGEDWDVDGDKFNHGCHVAGIVAAADGPSYSPPNEAIDWGVIGVAPHAKLVAVKVLSEYTGSGAFSWVIEGIIYAANNGADVINMSLGALLPRSGFYDELPDGTIEWVGANEVSELINAIQKAVTYAYQMGATTIVSAGNEALDANHTGNWVVLPACLNHLLAVSATAPYGIYYDADTNPDIPASYTNFGQSLIDLAAPGGDFDFPGDNWWYDMVLSTGSGNVHFWWAAGTSMAAPHVSGVAALIIDRYDGDITPAQVMTLLKNSADDLGKPGKDAWFGHGRVNAAIAVE